MIQVSGGTGAITASPSSPNVDVRYDPIARRLTLAGRAPGTTTVTLTDAAGATATVDVLVAAPAGVVPSDVTVELGGTVSPQFAATNIAAAIAASAQLRPGTHVDVHDATPGAPLNPGDTLEATAHVRIDGAGTFVDVTGTTSVHLRVETLPELDPQILFYSDDPEKLLAGTDGVLYRATVDATKPARTYFYHVAYGSTHRVFLALRATGADAHVQILGYAAGPSNAFAYVGHVATLKYLLARRAQESRIVAVTADTPYVQELGAQELQSGELVAGAFDLRVLDGGPVDVDVISTRPDVDPATLFGEPELPGDGHGRRGEFDLTTVPPRSHLRSVRPTPTRSKSGRPRSRICDPTDGPSVAITACSATSRCSSAIRAPRRRACISTSSHRAAARRRRSGLRGTRSRPKFRASCAKIATRSRSTISHPARRARLPAST